ncbi:hypothetical protein PGB90_003923 [Kerria lacca]
MKSYKIIRERFRDEYPDADMPNKSFIKRLMDKFKKTGSVLNALRGCSSPAVTDEKREEINARMSATPTLSFPKLAQVNVKHSSTYCAMRSIEYPYRICVLHELKPLDCGKRVKFCRWFLNYIRQPRHYKFCVF